MRTADLDFAIMEGTGHSRGTITWLSGDSGEERGAQARCDLALLVHREAAQQSAD